MEIKSGICYNQKNICSGKVHRKKVHEGLKMYIVGSDECMQQRMHNKKEG